MTDAGPRGCDGKETERKKGTGEIMSRKLQRTINQFKKVFPSLPGSARFVKEQIGFPISQSERPSAPRGPRLLLPHPGRPGTGFQKPWEWEGQFLCPSIWSCRDSVPGHTASFCPSSWHPGDGSPRAQAAPS